jgi:hypothetical protein
VTEWNYRSVVSTGTLEIVAVAVRVLALEAGMAAPPDKTEKKTRSANKPNPSMTIVIVTVCGESNGVN